MHFSYISNSNTLAHAEGQPSTGMDYEDVDLGGAANNDTTAIALDAAGNTYIAYLGWNSTTSQTTLKYATNRSGSWEVFTLDEDASNLIGQYPDIALDSAEDVHIVYQAFSGSNTLLKHAKVNYSNPTQYTLTVTVDRKLAQGHFHRRTHKLPGRLRRGVRERRRCYSGLYR